MDLKRFKFNIAQVSKKILKKDKKVLLKRIVAASMAGIIGLSTFASALVLSVNAATTAKITMVDLPRGSDPAYSQRAKWGHTTTLNFMNGYKETASQKWVLRHTSTSKNICYCIEPGTPQNNGDTVTKKDEDYWKYYPSNGIIETFEIKDFVGRILTYGYTGTINYSWTTSNSTHKTQMAQAIATQLLIWETVVGERDSDFNHITPTAGKNAIFEMIRSDHPLRSQIVSEYNSIVSSIQKHLTVPSFMAQMKNKATTVELKWDGSKYTATLTDTNNLLGNFNFYSSDPSVTLTVSGNKLIVSSATAPSSSVTISASKKSSVRAGTIIWDGSTSQDTVTYAQDISDPVNGYVKIEVTAGSAKIVKTSEDGVVSGISFTITGNGVNQTVTTGEDGTIQIDNLSPGTYTVTENSVDCYVPQTSQTVMVVGDEVATVTFDNTLKRGSLGVTKTSEDGIVSDVKFHLYGTSLSGLAVDEYAVTNESGEATFSNVLIGTNYTLEEVDTAVRYVVPNSQSVNVEWNSTTNVTVHNVLKKFRVTVTKADKETNTAQGNATLAGAVYGIYKGDELIDKYTTDANGRFTTDYYVCGDNWSIREITPSEGYLLDETSYHVGAEAKFYTVEKNDTTVDVFFTT